MGNPCNRGCNSQRGTRRWQIKQFLDFQAGVLAPCGFKVVICLLSRRILRPQSLRAAVFSDYSAVCPDAQVFRSADMASGPGGNHLPCHNQTSAGKRSQNIHILVSVKRSVGSIDNGTVQHRDRSSYNRLIFSLATQSHRHCSLPHHAWRNDQALRHSRTCVLLFHTPKSPVHNVAGRVGSNLFRATDAFKLAILRHRRVCRMVCHNSG